MKKLLIASLIASTTLTTGCAGLLFGGAAVGGAAVATTLHDRRTPGTVIDDRNLEVSISKNLIEDKYLSDYSHTNLTIFNGVVLVTGEASSQAVAQRIINTVKKTPNIKRIESDIFIGPKSSLLSRGKDSAITTKVKTALLALEIPNFDPTLINVSTERGTVYLMGLVTRNEANAIAQKASRVSGVKSVVKVFEYIDKVNTK